MEQPHDTQSTKAENDNGFKKESDDRSEAKTEEDNPALSLTKHLEIKMHKAINVFIT